MVDFQRNFVAVGGHTAFLDVTLHCHSLSSMHPNPLWQLRVAVAYAMMPSFLLQRAVRLYETSGLVPVVQGFALRGPCSGDSLKSTMMTYIGTQP
jgi:hypothetical protein